MRSFSAVLATGPRRVTVSPFVTIFTLCAEVDSVLSPTIALRMFAVTWMASALFDWSAGVTASELRSVALAAVLSAAGGPFGGVLATCAAAQRRRVAVRTPTKALPFMRPPVHSLDRSCTRLRNCTQSHYRATAVFS